MKETKRGMILRLHEDPNSAVDLETQTISETRKTVLEETGEEVSQCSVSMARKQEMLTSEHDITGYRFEDPPHLRKIYQENNRLLNQVWR